MRSWHHVTIFRQRVNNGLIHGLKVSPTCDRTCKINIHFCGKRERIEFFGRFCVGGLRSIPVRKLSSSELKRIQSFTRITRCGVLSLKKNLDKNICNNAGEIGYPLSSITSAVLLASGAKISSTQPDILLRGNR